MGLQQLLQMQPGLGGRRPEILAIVGFELIERARLGLAESERVGRGVVAVCLEVVGNVTVRIRVMSLDVVRFGCQRRTAQSIRGEVRPTVCAMTVD